MHVYNTAILVAWGPKEPYAETELPSGFPFIRKYLFLRGGNGSGHDVVLMAKRDKSVHPKTKRGRGTLMKELVLAHCCLPDLPPSDHRLIGHLWSRTHGGSGGERGPHWG